MAAVPKDFHQMMADKMSGMSDDGDDGASDGDGSDGYDDGYKAAVASFVDAVHSKDVDTAADALEQAIELCGKKAGKEPDGDEGGAPGHAALLLIPHGKK